MQTPLTTDDETSSLRTSHRRRSLVRITANHPGHAVQISALIGDRPQIPDPITEAQPHGEGPILHHGVIITKKMQSSNNVRMCVGYASPRDLDMTIYTDGVIRGRKFVHLASGNYVCRDLRAEVYGNVVATRDLSIGVGNASGRDVSWGRHDNVKIGVGNRSAGPIKIVVAGNRWWEAPQPS